MKTEVGTQKDKGIINFAWFSCSLNHDLILERSSHFHTDVACLIFACFSGLIIQNANPCESH